MAKTSDGKEIHDTHTCAVTGQIIHTVRDHDGDFLNVNENGDELTAWELAGPTDDEHNVIVQTDPDGGKWLTEIGREKLFDKSNTLYGILPDGAVIAALTYDSLITEHYNSTYKQYHETSLCKPMKRFVGPSDVWIDTNSYQTDAGMINHTGGLLKRVNPDIPNKTIFRDVFSIGMIDNEYMIPAPVMELGKTLWTHENYVTAMEDRIEAAYSIEK